MTKHPNLASISLNTFYQFLSRAISGITGLLITRILASQIGLSGYGQYQMVIAYISLFWVFTDFGLSTLLVREAASRTMRLKLLLGSLITIKTIISLVFIVFGFLGLFVFSFSQEVKLAIMIGLITVLIQSHISTLISLFQLFLAYGYQFLSVFIGSAVWLLGVIVLAVGHQMSLIGLMLVFILNYTVILAVSILLLRRKVKFYFVLDKVLLKRVFKLALPLGMAQLLNLLAYKQDSFLLSILPLSSISNANAVGIYSLSYKFFEIGIVLPMFFMNVLYPVLASLFGSKKFELFQKYAMISSVLLGLVGAFGVLFYQVFAPFLVSLLSSSTEFTDSVSVLRTLSWSLPASYLLPLTMYLLIIFRRQKWLFTIYFYGFLVNLFINLVFIPKVSYFAAAWATIATEWSMLGLFVVAVIISWKKQMQLQRNSM